jgi:small-conductance mechanosensitive channel
MAIRFCILLTVTMFSLSSSSALAQAPTASVQTASIAEAVPGKGEEGVPLVFWNRQITVFRSNYDQFSPADRAARAADRLAALPEDPSWQITATETTSGQYSGAIISANGHIAFAILTTDLDSESNETLQSAEDRAITQLRAALEARAQQRSFSVVLRGVGLSIAATLVLILGLWLVIRGASRLRASLEKTASVQSRRLNVGGFDLQPALHGINSGLAKLIVLAAVAALVYLWLTFVLLRFPYSQPWGQQLGTFLVSLFATLGTGLLRSIPGMFTVFVIFLITRTVARLVRGFFSEVEKGSIEFRGLHPDTARASRHLVVMLIWIFAITIAYPYIPGSNTDAFKGVSVLVGLMVSLGSAGFVNQIMSGLVVVYSRALRPGEFVRIGDDVGTVLEVGMLSTKILTYMREEITIPNGVLVGTKTANYSRHTTATGVVLKTTVTIGYDAPWRQVHGMLLHAAEQTAGIRKDPAPRVLQKTLSDFYVEYELVFHVDEPSKRVTILSELHTCIQDQFNEQGVQIMSPHFEGQPSEKVFVPKSQWFPKSVEPSIPKDGR